MITLPEGVRLDRGSGGLERVVVDVPAARAELYLQGATLTSWVPRGQPDVLWLSPLSVFRADKAIRGGVPICFPWFGKRAGDPSAPQHGFARDTAWELRAASIAAGGAAELVLALAPEPKFRLAVTYTVHIGAKLELAFEVKNVGETEMTYEEALHAYFAVKDVRGVEVHGLEGAEYLDKTAGFERRREHDAPIRLVSETDRVHVDTTSAIEIRDPGHARKISIQKDGSRTTVLWNPWPERARAMADLGEANWPTMLCIEPANAAQNAISLRPGEQHTLRVRVVVNSP